MTRITLPALAALVALATPQAARAADRPNVLIVLTDDQGLGDFSFTGNPVLKTPHLDAFARESVRLTSFHVAPMCSPTRGQLMTGLAALRNGATSVTAGRTFLRPGLPTLPEAFAKAGYKTGIFGKWHLGDVYPHRPVDKGFHESVYHLGWGQLHSTPEFDWPLIDGRYFHNGVERRYKGHCTDFWFDSAMAWMKDRKAKGEPFLCYLPTNAPHAPHIDLEEYIAPYRGKGPAAFFGMIAHIDERFGHLDRFLAAEGLRDDTVVIFMTDNGGTAGVPVFNAGLRGRKTEYYEGGHRVPCWVRWPNGKLGEPRDIGPPTQITDLFPTLCDLCGVPQPKWDAKDEPYRGTSLAGLLRGEPKPLADRKLVVQYGQVPKKFDCCVIWGKWRLVKGDELYDVHADRAQATNVADQNPEVVKAMRDHYEAWWQGVEPLLTDFVPQSIGAKQQPVVELTSGDWENIYADNSGFVREAVGGPTGGTWHILVEEPGEYEFTLRRWPGQTGAALGDKYEPSEKSPGNRPKGKQVTKGFPTIAAARLEIAGVKAEAKADPKATAATITATLPAGKTTLKAWFADAAGTDLCGAFFVTVRRQPAAGPRPNVVIFLADDLGWGDLGCYGHPRIQTPNLDAFAKQGVRLTQCYSASAVCSPSRSAILTGRTPHRNGVYTWIAEGAEVHLRTSEVALPKLLKEAGYATCHAGKWHLNGKFNSPDQPQPNDHGYDHWMATQNNAAPGHKDPTNFVRNGKPVGRLEGFSAPLVVDEAIDWLANGRDKTKPFFLAVWTHEPHLPIETDPRFQEPYRDMPEDFRQHHGNVTQLDHAFGRLMKALDEQKLADTTFVFVTSDNGPEGTGEQGRTRGSTGGLRGRKRSMYEGGIRVPGIARWPGHIRPGTTSDVPVIGSDLFPTVLGLCGVKGPADRVIDGTDVLPVLTGKAAAVDRKVPLYWRLGMAPPKENLHVAMRDGDWKLLASQDFTNFELYNLKADPQEKADLKAKEPDRFAAMRDRLGALNAEVEKEGPDWWKRLSPNGGGPVKKK